MLAIVSIYFQSVCKGSFLGVVRFLFTSECLVGLLLFKLLGMFVNILFIDLSLLEFSFEYLYIDFTLLFMVMCGDGLLFIHSGDGYHIPSQGRTQGVKLVRRHFVRHFHTFSSIFSCKSLDQYLSSNFWILEFKLGFVLEATSTITIAEESFGVFFFSVVIH